MSDRSPSAVSTDSHEEFDALKEELLANDGTFVNYAYGDLKKEFLEGGVQLKPVGSSDAKHVVLKTKSTSLSPRSRTEKMQMPPLWEVPEELLREYLKDLFEAGNTVGDGMLTPSRFAYTLSLSGFKFDAAAIVSMVRSADVNKDGLIAYHEFLPTMLGLLAGAKAESDSEKPVAVFEMYEDAELEQHLATLFHEADTNSDGVLQPKEFLELLVNSGLGLPAELVLDLFLAADVNQDGVIQYEEFVPAMVGLICGIKLAREALSEPPSPLLKPISPELGDADEFAGSPEFGL